MDKAILLDALLMDACSDPVDDTWNEYVISLHCVTYNIIARYAGQGSFVVKSFTKE